MVRIILIRHGETNWNIQGRYQGQEDTRLSERGFAQAGMLAQGLKDVHIDAAFSSPLQAGMLAQGLKDVHIDAAFSSPLKRSLLTCRACADLHKLPVHTDERLTEINHGAWEGELACDIEARYPEEFKQWHTQPHLVQMPGGENLEDVRKRARAAFDEFAQKYDGKTLLISAHDAVNKAIICDVLGLDMSHFWNIKQDNACINVLECNEGVWRAVLLNSTTHLGYLFSGVEQAGL